MTNHYFDEDGYFTFATPAAPGSIAAPDCIRLKYPLDIPEGKWPKVNATGDGFNMVDDFVGREGYVNGKWRKWDKHGPLPECWTDMPPMIPDMRTAEEKREEAYRIEADPLFKEIQVYEGEAKAWRKLENFTRAAECDAKVSALEAEWLAIKEAIRQRFPDHPFYLLNSTGTYHAEGCAHISESAERLTLSQIAAKGNVKPCTRCNAPSVPTEGEE